MKIEKNWWTYNAFWRFFVGIVSVASGNILGLLDLLIGLALLQKSNVIYWILLILTSAGFISSLFTYAENPMNFVFSLVSFVFIFFLSKERSVNKIKKANKK